MSNVTLDEILDFTAAAFSVPKQELLWPPKNKAAAWRLSWAKYAWICAVAMAREHTNYSYVRIAQDLGREIKGGRMHDVLRQDVNEFFHEVRKYAALRAIVERVEGQIELAHELRLNSHERPGKVGKVPVDHEAILRRCCEELTNHRKLM
jgi:hypothetical protein